MGQLIQNGESVAGYVVERLIGRGALGEVYLARRGTNSAPLAVKVLLPDVADENPEYIQRFLREGNVAKKLCHPNVVSVHDVGYCEERGFYYLVMDYIRGSSLRTAIGLGGAMSVEDALCIAASVAEALASGERHGLVHRDIKPENIMIEDDGTVKLVDFGVVKSSEADSLRTMSSTVFGTPDYISPEQALDSGKVDFRADVYSLGVVLFEMLAGRRPYDGGSPADALRFLFSPEPIPDVRTVNPAVPEELARIVSGMCEKDAAKRISSASAFLGELAAKGIVYGKRLRSLADSGKPFDYAAYTRLPGSDTLTFETKDTEIGDFVAKLKARRMRKKWLGFAFVAAVVLLLAGMALLFAFVSGAANFTMIHPLVDALIEMKYVKAGGPAPTPEQLAKIKAEAIYQLDQYSSDPAFVAKWHLQPNNQTIGQSNNSVVLHRLVLVFHGGECLLSEEV